MVKTLVFPNYNLTQFGAGVFGEIYGNALRQFRQESLGTVFFKKKGVQGKTYISATILIKTLF